MAKVAILGLDSMPPAYFFGTYRADMPNLGRLMSQSLCAHLESTNPPITVPAWTAMMSSKDPGQLGFYGFRNRKDHSYDGYQFANVALVKEPRTVGHPRTRRQALDARSACRRPTRRRPIDGEMVTCFLTPSTKSDVHLPARAQGGGRARRRRLRPRRRRLPHRRQGRRCWSASTTRRASTSRSARHLLRTRPWDFFMLVEMGVDRIHHGVLELHGSRASQVRARQSLRAARCATTIATSTARSASCSPSCPSDTIVLVVSDHGSKKMDGGICFNEWLIAEGYLTLAEPPDEADADRQGRRSTGAAPGPGATAATTGGSS